MQEILPRVREAQGRAEWLRNGEKSSSSLTSTGDEEPPALHTSASGPEANIVWVFESTI